MFNRTSFMKIHEGAAPYKGAIFYSYVRLPEAKPKINTSTTNQVRRSASVDCLINQYPSSVLPSWLTLIFWCQNACPPDHPPNLYVIKWYEEWYERMRGLPSWYEQKITKNKSQERWPKCARPMDASQFQSLLLQMVVAAFLLHNSRSLWLNSLNSLFGQSQNLHVFFFVSSHIHGFPLNWLYHQSMAWDNGLAPPLNP